MHFRPHSGKSSSISGKITLYSCIFYEENDNIGHHIKSGWKRKTPINIHLFDDDNDKHRQIHIIHSHLFSMFSPDFHYLKNDEDSTYSAFFHPTNWKNVFRWLQTTKFVSIFQNIVHTSSLCSNKWHTHAHLCSGIIGLDTFVSNLYSFFCSCFRTVWRLFGHFLANRMAILWNRWYVSCFCCCCCLYCINFSLQAACSLIVEMVSFFLPFAL